MTARMGADLVMAALQDVDLVFREAITLSCLQEPSCLEIAEILAIPTGTVTSRIYRGKRQLRARLEQRATGGKSVGFVSAGGCS